MEQLSYTEEENRKQQSRTTLQLRMFQGQEHPLHSQGLLTRSVVF